MSELIEYLKLCKQSYYEGNPIISDAQYDALEESCGEETGVGTNRGRAKHWFRMYSLQKLYKGDTQPEGIYYVTPKLDGAALAVRYLNKSLHSLVTRGDGEYGEDVSFLVKDYSKVLHALGISTKIPLSGAVQITGEIVAPKVIPNARNFASGALGLKDPIEFGSRILEFFAHNIQENPMPSYLGTLCYLEDMGFKTPRHSTVGEYPQDGEVFRLDCNEAFDRLGYTSKHPRGAFALKERSEGVVTKLLDVEWNTGKSGKVTPVAILESVDIDGAQVSRATLNNPGFIKAMGLQIGDSVFVERAGGIIPRIIKKAE